MSASNAVEMNKKARTVWASGRFADIALLGTTTSAASFIRFAGIRPGQTVLDIGTGTGTVAVTAARRGALVTGVDITPELLEEARANAAVAGVDVEWQEGDAAALPFPDASFDVVVSQFGHMFAPDVEAAARELLRVVKPGGTVAFTSWPPDHFVGRSFALNMRYLPPPSGGSPMTWGVPQKVRELLGDRVRDVHFETGVMHVPSLSPTHYRLLFEERFGPIVQLVKTLEGRPETLAAWRTEYERLITAYFEGNGVRQEYLLTRAVVAPPR